MTNDQVRWKINALVKKYKEVVDNNSKSGRARMEFEWYEQMDEILGSRQRACTGHTISSKVTSPSATSTSTSCENEYSSGSSSLCTSPSKLTSSKNDFVNSNITGLGNRKRSLHGTGSKIAATKIELEKQWLHHLQKKEERDRIKDQRYVNLLEVKKENVKLKKRQLDLKETELEQQKELAIKKAKEKKNRHMELIEIEQLKYKLLKKLVEDKNQNVCETIDSD